MATGTETDAERAQRVASRIREHVAPLTDLGRVLQLLSFDQDTGMPPAGNASRGQQTATLSRLWHDGMASPALAELLDEAEGADLEGDDAALVREVRREADKARRVPGELVQAMAIAGSDGQEAWVGARANADFAAFRPFLERNIELAREYAACFDVDEPYDALLDDHEPGMLTREVREAFAPLRAELPALVAAAAEHSPGPPVGPFALDAQRRAVDLLLRRIGFEDESWVLAVSAHPFSATPGRGDNRITTRFSEDSLESLMSCLHEFGHGLYEAQIDPALDRTPLAQGVSMAVHESQSRLWEVFVGLGLPFWRGIWPQFCEAFGGAGGIRSMSVEQFVAALNTVAPTLIRVDADPVSYPLHIVLRFDLELALVSGDLAVADLPGAWNDGMRELLGIVPADDRTGVLQDIHWSSGAFGYFPTYALGTVLAAQLWDVVRRELPDVEASIEAGEFGVLRDWLADRIHRHGKRMSPRELIAHATGGPLEAGPYLAYARSRAEGSTGG